MENDFDEFKETTYVPSVQPNNIFLTPNRPERVDVRIKKENEPAALDVQVGGNHYKQFKIQPVEFCQLNKIPYCEANVIKYICRHKFKNGIEDLKKAKHYIDLLIQMEYQDVKNQGVQAE